MAKQKAPHPFFGNVWVIDERKPNDALTQLYAERGMERDASCVALYTERGDDDYEHKAVFLGCGAEEMAKAVIDSEYLKGEVVMVMLLDGESIDGLDVPDIFCPHKDGQCPNDTTRMMDDEPKRSTYCGSMTEDELIEHVKECGVCREDIGDPGPCYIRCAICNCRNPRSDGKHIGDDQREKCVCGHLFIDEHDVHHTDECRCN